MSCLNCSVADSERKSGRTIYRKQSSDFSFDPKYACEKCEINFDQFFELMKS